MVGFLKTTLKVKYPEIIQDSTKYIDEVARVCEDAVSVGTPLPKGHGRLIDADEIQFENAEFDTYGDYCIAFDAIDQADTIIEADKESTDEK